MDLENIEIQQTPEDFNHEGEAVVNLLEQLQKKIVEKEGYSDKNLDAFISSRNCRIDNLYRIANSHNYKLMTRNPNNNEWYSYGNNPLEMVKQISFAFLSMYEEENHNTILQELGLTRRTLENWLINHNFPLLKPFLKLSEHVGFQFEWKPITKFCKTCKYRLFFNKLSNLQICWNMRSKKDKINEFEPACEFYENLKIGK